MVCSAFIDLVDADRRHSQCVFVWLARLLATLSSWQRLLADLNQKHARGRGGGAKRDFDQHTYT